MKLRVSVVNPLWGQYQIKLKQWLKNQQQKTERLNISGRTCSKQSSNRENMWYCTIEEDQYTHSESISGDGYLAQHKNDLRNFPFLWISTVTWKQNILTLIYFQLAHCKSWLEFSLFSWEYPRTLQGRAFRTSQCIVV